MEDHLHCVDCGKMLNPDKHLERCGECRGIYLDKMVGLFKVAKAGDKFYKTSTRLHGPEEA